MRDPRANVRRLGRLLPRAARERLFEPACEDALAGHWRARGTASGLPLTAIIALWLQCWRLALVQRPPRIPGHPDPRYDRSGFMDALLQDLRFALRAARSRPAFSALIVTILAVGIGASVVVFTLLNSVVLRPLPYPDAERLAYIATLTTIDANRTEASVTAADFGDWRRETTMFDGLAGYHDIGFTLTDGEAPERVDGAWVSSNLFELLGVRMHAGRSFGADPTAFERHEAVVSHGLWQQRYGADPDLENLELRIDNVPHRVVGVLPPGFVFAREADMFVAADRDVPPPPIEVEGDYHDNRDIGYFKVLGRVRQGVTFDQARQELETVQLRLEAVHNSEGPPREALVRPLHEARVGDVRAPLLALLAAVGLVLLIACADIAGLLLARATTRQHEIAVRSALGASATRLLRQLLAESMLLAMAGGLAGIGVALAVVEALPALLPQALPRLGELAVDARVLAFAVAASALTGLLFGAIPALQLTRRDVRGVLQGARGNIAVGLRSARGWLVVGEVALALLLVTGAGVLGRNLMALLHTDPGFDPRGVLAVRLALPEGRYDEAATRQFYDAVLERMDTIPGVDAVGLGMTLPFSGSAARLGIFLEGQPVDEVTSQQRAVLQTVNPSYFAALGIPLRRGRAFGRGDVADGEMVAIVSDEFVRRYLPAGSDPLSLRLTMGGDERLRIVGVVGDIRHDGFGEPVQPHLYVPYSQMPFRYAAFLLRTGGDPTSLVPAVRQAILRIDPLQAVADARPIEFYMERSLVGLRLGVWVLAAFAMAALALASLGIFGLVSYAVSQRVAEIGLRVALGAAPRQVLGLMTWQGFVLVGAGLALGAGLVALLQRLVDAEVAGVATADPVAFAGAALVLAAVGALAAYLPARRATRVDPVVALRNG